MQRAIAIAFVLLLAGCSAPAPDSQPTTTEPTTVDGLTASVSNVSVNGETIDATIRVTNVGENETTADLAIRYVENDSFALVGTISPGPGTTTQYPLQLPTLGTDPENLTIQVRLDGQVMTERAVIESQE